MKQLQPHLNRPRKHNCLLTHRAESEATDCPERQKDSRRNFLKKSVLASLGAFVMLQPVSAAEMLQNSIVGGKSSIDPKTQNETAVTDEANRKKAEAARVEERHLRLWNVQTDEYYEGPYWASGRFLTPAIEQISFLLRDYRREEAWPIDPYVIDFMYAVYSKLDTTEPLHILSGYRSAQTNAELARTYERVASNSLHIQGKAVDFRLPSVKARKLRNLAIEANRGGVGYYADRDFIHIDTGPVRFWR